MIQFDEISKEIRNRVKGALGVILLDWDGFPISSDIRNDEARDAMAILTLDIVKEVVKLSDTLNEGKILTCSVRIGDFSLYIIPGKSAILVVVVKKVVSSIRN